MAIFQSSLLLLLAVTLFSPAGLVLRQANALQGMGPPPARRLEHVDMNARMIRKRAVAAVPDAPLVKRQATTTTDVAPTNTPTPPPNTSTQENTSQTVVDENTTSCQGILGCILDGIGGGGNSDTTSRSSSSSSSRSSSSRSSSSSASQTSQTSGINTSTTRRTTNTRTAVVTATDAAQTTDASKDEKASFLPKPVIIGLIVTASCIVGGAAIWTVIRKWKFSPSRHFEDRLEPINWEPTQGSGLPHDPTVAALARGATTNSHPRNGSIGSSEGHQGSRNMTSVQDQPISMAPDFPPAHDFTAGPSGQGGYVDMYRGPSPNPAANYGHYETPNPYDAYDYNGYNNQRRY